MFSQTNYKYFIKLASIIFVLFVLSFFLRSTNANAKIIEKFHTNGAGAIVNVWEFSDCKSVSLFLNVSESMYKFDTDPAFKAPPSALFTVDIYDMCNFESLFGYCTIELTTFNYTKNMETLEASGTGTLIWIDPFCFELPCTILGTEAVEMKVKFIGQTAFVAGSNNFRSRVGGLLTNAHLSGNYRYAHATGSVICNSFTINIDYTEPLIPGPLPMDPFGNAGPIIGRFRESYMIVSKPQK